MCHFMPCDVKRQDIVKEIFKVCLVVIGMIDLCIWKINGARFINWMSQNS